MSGDDPFYCDKRQNCSKSGPDAKSCSIFVNLTFEKPIVTSLGALGLGKGNMNLSNLEVTHNNGPKTGSAS